MSTPIASAHPPPLPELGSKPPAEPGFWARFLHRIAAHFAAHRRRSSWSFFWRVTLEGFVLTIAIAIAADTFFTVEDTQELDSLSTTELFVLVCLAVPIYETLLQIIPGELVRVWRPRFWIQVLVVTVPFAAIHFTNDFWSGICAGVIGGFYLAFIYVHYREKSMVLAASLTVASHAFGNTFAITLYLAEKYIDTLKAIFH